MVINWGALGVVAAGIYAASRHRPVTADNVNNLPARSPQVDLAA